MNMSLRRQLMVWVYGADGRMMFLINYLVNTFLESYYYMRKKECYWSVPMIF